MNRSSNILSLKEFQTSLRDFFYLIYYNNFLMISSIKNKKNLEEVNQYILQVHDNLEVLYDEKFKEEKPIFSLKKK